MIIRLVRQRDGQNLIEYALLATFVSLAAYLAVSDLGRSLRAQYDAMAAVAQSVASKTTEKAGDDLDNTEQGTVVIDGDDEDSGPDIIGDGQNGPGVGYEESSGQGKSGGTH